jgi:AcrR family transcriptional regulator
MTKNKKQSQKGRRMSPKAFTEEEKSFVRNKLIEAAKACLATTGIKKTTVEQLSRAAGISKGAFYLFYDSKELLFLDALESIQTKIHQTLISEMKRHKNKREAFVQLIKKMFEDFRPILNVLANEEYEVLLRRVPQERINQHIEMDDRASRLFSEEISGNKMDAELLSAVLRMLMLGMLHQYEVGSRAEEAFDYLLEAVADKIFLEA